MILEHALLTVAPHESAAFEAALTRARPLIAATPGFVDLQLSRCLERPDRYLLLVRWDQLSDHTEGFRGSERYQQWKDLLHHFYRPFPLVEHFSEVPTAG